MLKFIYNCKIMEKFLMKNIQYCNNPTLNDSRSCVYYHNICSCTVFINFHKLWVGKEKRKDFICKKVLKSINNTDKKSKYLKNS